ncbi:MAG: [FeFe] hydrogenase H-cluster maturation GTPase HydF [Oscillospiraceae bacterium]|jgi:[FeFe] hydrogenase H-cluster maturation GTPase HydF|nr:[FeFe] hydrogenase H-cluster maturation GTPase HydF [Oscillospiraceae bacterium]
MTQTPLANREHIAIFGNTNAGKSSLFNMILNQDAAIVSEKHGTTTDPVIRAMELIPFGPIALIDTAGINDKTVLGDVRTKKTQQILSRTDFALYLAPCNAFDNSDYAEFLKGLEDFQIEHILIFTKTDLVSAQELEALKSAWPKAVFTSINDLESILSLKERLSTELAKGQKEESILGDLLPEGSTVLMVVPCDSEAPKGRLILPQVQLIRDCLDNGFKVAVSRELELAEMLQNLKQVDLVVTDSQAFKLVSEIVPTDIKLCSFSILFGRHKGDIGEYIKGAAAIGRLKPDAKIAITEGCTHNHTHEDIGQVKIPNWLRSKAGEALSFDFYAGHDFPEHPEEYDLVVQCGGCMQNRRAILHRINLCKKVGVPITNYGILIAEINGILQRSTELFK